MFIVFRPHIYAGAVTDESYPRIKIIAGGIMIDFKSSFWEKKVSWKEQTERQEVLFSFEMSN